ncbi:hypothetical protein HOLleu_03868 [Holothuria leucospilota]|uniref:Uncharacterized protein n=1 Tax=Holothuria leucospilota TaxID=206669 RepID=A0A9Q1CTX7_HOLLE|nr:hypothetical protein HOLleu_03868 [Holothuria leucospilota]
MFDQLKQKLKDEKLCHDKINDIITEVSGSDFFEAAHSEGGPLRSDHLRKEFFKKNLKYVSPVAVNLGVDEISGSQRIGYYVPILQTIKTMVNPKILREQSPQCSQDGKTRHFVDGVIYKQNELFKQNPSALQIVLFQDAFEVSNPLGSAKGKHKLLAVYYTLGSPGLPPCLAHDIFEGVVQYDLALFINYFVKTKKWFSYQHLNYKVKHLKYVGNDAKSKPAEVYHSAQKCGGNASQNWCLLRLLPFLIGVKIPNYEDPVWQLFLTLKNIVDIICAPQTSEDQIAVLQDLISEYLESRVDLFSKKHLRPKHHYLERYPWLTLQFGPLIWMWTLRFESKHSYFKRTLRYSGNFKNVGLTLSEKHQLLQAYVTSSNIFSDTVECFNGIQFQEDL